MEQLIKIIKLKSENGFELTDRELAVKWWSALSDETKVAVLETYAPGLLNNNVSYENMYWLWLKQQTLTGPLY